MPGKSLVRVPGKRARTSFVAGSIESTKPVSDAASIESECGVTAMNFAIVPDLAGFAASSLYSGKAVVKVGAQSDDANWRMQENLWGRDNPERRDKALPAGR